MMVVMMVMTDEDGDDGYGAISPRRASKYENPTQRNRRQPWPQS